MRRRLARRRERGRDLRATTYHLSAPEKELGGYFELLDVSVFRNRRLQIAEVTDLFLKHRFDLLGSGWVQIRYGMLCSGVK